VRYVTEVGVTRRTRMRLVAVGTLALVGFAALVTLLYAASMHAFPGDSDGATVVLEGQAMRTGQLMLHGWALSLDSFWTVDAVFYMVVECVTGMRAMLVYLVPAILAALVIVVGALLARDGRSGAPGWVGAGTVVLLLAFPSHVLSTFFLRGPLHVGTALVCLVAFSGLRSGRLGWGWVVAVLCFALGTLGDFQMAALGVAPAAVAGLVAMARTRRWRSGSSSVAAAGAGLVLAGVLREVADAVGTFSVNAGHPRASTSQVLTNLKHIVTWGANMLGVGHGSLGNGGVPGALQALHLFGLAVLVAGVAVSTVALVRGAIRGKAPEVPEAPNSPWRLDDLLVVAFFSSLVVFTALTTSDDPGFMRYLTSAVIFGSILAGRWVGGSVATVASPRLLRTAAAAFLVVAVAFAAGVGWTVTGPRPTQAVAHLGRFLESHKLRQGIGDYWSASVTTVTTNGVVTVRPVVTTPAGTVVRYQRQSAADWYARQSFEFLVYDTARPWGGVSSVTASRTFGPVAHTYAVGTYRVLVWDHSLSVSTVGFAPIPVGAQSALARGHGRHRFDAALS
jgi:hypothetical protein